MGVVIQKIEKNATLERGPGNPEVVLLTRDSRNYPADRDVVPVINFLVLLKDRIKNYPGKG